MTDDELLAAIAEHVGDDEAKAKQFAINMAAKAAPDGARAVAQVTYNRGLSKRTTEVAGKAGELQAALTKATDELEAKNAELIELRSNVPNWQRQREELDRKWQAKLDAAEQKAAEIKQARLLDKVEIERGKFVAALRIGQDGGVDKDYGELLPPYYVGQFVADQDSQTVKIRELGESNAFYDPADGEPAEQLARDVIAKLPPKVKILGTPEGGGGTQNGTGTVDKATAHMIENKQSNPMYRL